MPTLYPPLHQPVVDRTGHVTPVWLDWLRQLVAATGTGGASTTGPYVLAGADGTLTAARILTAGAGITVTDGGAGGPITVAATGGSSAPDAATYLTVSDETADLANSRRVVAGTGIAFDDTVPNVRTIEATGTAVPGYWTILTDGDLTAPEIIYAGGDVLSVFVPT